VTVTEALPAGLTLISMSGSVANSGWGCTGNSCSRSDALNGGASYPPITVLVNVGLNAPLQVVNQVSAAYTVGGNSQLAIGSDVTNIQGSASAPDFTITASQNPQTVAPGGSATYSIAVNPLGSFGSSAVRLSMSAIAGATASVSASAQSGTPATLTVNTFSSTSLGTIPILITGISGATTHYAVANLRVAPAAPAAITTPPPGQFIPGGATQFTWNSGNGASQYTLTAGSTPGAANYYSGSASSAQSANVNLPSTLGQTVYVTLRSSTPAGVALAPQTYPYVVSTQGTTQPIAGLTLVANQPTANVNNNGVEAAYTYNFTGADARAVKVCLPSTDAVTARLIQQTASTITIGFTAQPGSRAQAFTFDCQCPTGPTGPGGTNDTPPVLSGVSPASIQTPTLGAGIQIQGSYFGDPSDGVEDNVEICSTSGGGCYSVDILPQSDNLIIIGAPTMPADNYLISVETDAGVSKRESLGVSAPAQPVYDTPPQITGVTPGDIPALSGQAVAITGTNLGSAGSLSICQGLNCLPYTMPSPASWTDTVVNVVVDASAATPGSSYTVTLSTTADSLGNSYLAAPGAPADSASASLLIDQGPQQPSITVTVWTNDNPLTPLVVTVNPSEPIVYGGSQPSTSDSLTLTVPNAVPGVSYVWSVTGPGSGSYTPPPALTYASLAPVWGIQRILPTAGVLTFAVTAQYPNGDGSTSRSSVPVEVGIRTDDVIVVGWINPAGVPSPDPSEATSFSVLNGMPPSGSGNSAFCNAEVGTLSQNALLDPISGIGLKTGDRAYILDWMFKFGGNTDPAQVIPGGAFLDATGVAADPAKVSTFTAVNTNYKLVNRFQVKMRITIPLGGVPYFTVPPTILQGQSMQLIGTTVNPCGAAAGFLGFLPGQSGFRNGLQPTSPSGGAQFNSSVSIINDGSPDANAIEAFNTLSGLGVAPAVFWESIGSRITFTAAGGTSPVVNVQPYPTYYVYINGAQVSTTAQASNPINEFVSGNSSGVMGPYPFGMVACPGLGLLPTVPGGRCGNAVLPPDPTARIPTVFCITGSNGSCN
jgi:hypothetical protein